MIDDNSSLGELNSFYSEYLRQRQYLSPITKGLADITYSLSTYWKEISLDNAPFIPASSHLGIIPAIILRVVVKGAIGAVEGLLIDILRHRYETNDWSLDSGKFTEEEALEAMVFWGALINSGGFLSR